MVVLVVVVTFGGMLANRACGAPVDVSGTTNLPAWLVAIKERDEIAYPVHALVGTLLNEAGCSPMAAGLQWIKAGAHARTEQEVDATEQGLSAARGRAGQPAAFDAMLCPYLASGFASAQQAAITQRAGLACT